MKKTNIKFYLALILLINTIILVLFFPDVIGLLEIYLYPLFFIYFLMDSFSVILPIFNKDIYSSKMQKNKYMEVTGYDVVKLKKIARKNNKIAIIVFVLYSLGTILVGLSFTHFKWFDTKILYLVFFGINFADYFCIKIWCPFRAIFFKNSCCTTCRISNWDRIMKFGILIFIPNIYTITIFILGVFIFMYWEFHHFVHPQRFYRISNQSLWCVNCEKVTCSKKEKNINIKE